MSEARAAKKIRWRILLSILGLAAAFSSILLDVRGARAIDAQGEALLSWKATLKGPSHSNALSDWNPNDPTPCRWSGVSCDDTNRLVELNLQYVDMLGTTVPSNLSVLAASLSKLVLLGANLSGPIPPKLGELSHLTQLDLSGNALTGTIPHEIGNLSALRWLILYDNQLAGEIPPTIGRLANLQVFRAGGNKNLHGSLPPEISNCTGLTMLGLAETSISGSLPPTLGQLNKLHTLAIYTALLSGPIPPQLGQCGELHSIYLHENSLSGSIPPQLGNLKMLQNLLLWQNDLVGVIPPELGRCSDLAVVDLSINGLTGRIPSTLGNLTALQELQLSVNQISGPIPPAIAGCRNLTDLELDNNQISGVIPAELGGLGNLRMLFLWENKLVGSIPPAIGNCANLEAVDLSQNGLTGSIPRELFRLPRLSKLLLLGNGLSGDIPPDIGNCSSLIRFRANENRIAGKIPPEIGALKNLSFLDLGSNRLIGSIPPEIARCRNLTFVDLRSNAISGTIPAGLFEGLVSLQFLDLSSNSIGGGLPSELGLLTSLTKLILGENRFSGQIPPAIGSCLRLQLLDLSKNALSGEIPASLGKIGALEIALNLSWNILSGKIPAEFANLNRLGALDLSHNRLSGVLQPLAGLHNLVTLNVSFNNFSGRVPNNPFFSKLPYGDLEGNPALCFAHCSGTEGGKVQRGARTVARVATVVLLSAALALLAAAAIVFLDWRQARGGGCEDEEMDGDMSPPWEVTLYQKIEIGVADVARSLTAANVIGRGWSGVVYSARMPSTGTLIAVKRFRACDEAGPAAFACEIGALARVRHRNIVRLLGWAANRQTRLLFYDYLPNGTLGGLLHGSEGPAMEWEVRLGIAVGVAEGLAYLHHDCVPPIIHRDVKADNVLLGERYEACLADFGLAHLADDGTSAVAGDDSIPPPLAGSNGYIAPEYACMTRITKKGDVYSFGVLLLEIITGKRPVDQNVVQWVRDHLRSKRDPAEVVDPRLKGRPNTRIQVQGMLKALGIALMCASRRPDDRPSMKDVAALLREIRHDETPPGGGKRAESSLSAADNCK